MDILLLLNPFVLFILFGWVGAWYLFRRGEKRVAMIAFLVWFALFLRFPILFFLLGDDFMANIPWQLRRDAVGVMSGLMILLIPALIVFILSELYRKRFAQALILFLLLPITWFSTIESYFIFYPLIDTTRSPEFTLEGFNRIRPGMTRDQVRTLIGDPVENAGQYHRPCEGQTGDGAAPPLFDFAWLNASVCYDETEHVTETERMWVPD